MLKDLTRADWLSILNIPEHRAPAVLILRGTRNFSAQYRAMRPYFENVLDIGSPNGVIEDVLIGDVRGCPVAFACAYGGPMASDVVHVFGTLGARTVIQIGNCGALADDLDAGDLFLADRAYCGEGAAQYYKPDGKWVAASPQLLQSEALSALRPEERHIGAIYTTAALFAEGMEDLERWFAEGFAAVDMETATTYAVAEHFGMERIAILYGFDNPRRREHLLVDDKDKDVHRAAGNRRMKELALALAVEVSAKQGSRCASPSSAATLRDCRAEEAEAVLELWRQAGATASLTDTAAGLGLAITESAAIVLVAEKEGQLVGSVIGSFDGWRGNVYRLAVHPAHRRQGLAKALVAEVERRLARQGAKRMTALVEKDHAWAMGFWQAAGYDVDHRIVRLVRNP